MNKQIELGTEARKKLKKGINKLADAVSSTLGPSGRNIIYNLNGEVFSTKDGVSVAKSISSLEDPIENLGVQMVKQTSIKTGNEAGDGTTTSTLLSQTIINEGLDYLDKGMNAVEIKRGIDEAVMEVKSYIHNNIAQQISDGKQIKQIASISANNDNEIGELISAALDKVGNEGVVYIEESKSGDTKLETVEGIQFDKGYKSPYFVTDNNTMSCILENVYILLLDKRITQIKEIVNVLNFISIKQDASLLIISEDLDGEALSTLLVNKMRGIIKVCAVKAPDFGERRKLIMEDIAILTGGKVVSIDKGMNIEKFDGDSNWLGKARVINISKEKTTIIDGAGNEDEIKERIEEIKTQIDNAKTPFEKEKLQERLSKFVGGVSIIHVGGNSEIEIKEKKDRVDDALNAAKSSMEEGIVPGGGLALLLARKNIKFDSNKSHDFLIGKKIVDKACASPFVKILQNAGYNLEECFELISKIEKEEDKWKGYDLKTKSIINMKDAGIIDPAKVTRCALENAASVAGTIILTEGVIFEEKDKNPQPQPNMMDGII